MGDSREAKSKCHAAIWRGEAFLQFPFRDSGKTVAREAFTRSEPRKDNRHAAANRFADGELASRAHEQERRFAIFLESGNMRAKQINLGWNC